MRECYWSHLKKDLWKVLVSTNECTILEANHQNWHTFGLFNLPSKNSHHPQQLFAQTSSNRFYRDLCFCASRSKRSRYFRPVPAMAGLKFASQMPLSLSGALPWKQRHSLQSWHQNRKIRDFWVKYCSPTKNIFTQRFEVYLYLSFFHKLSTQIMTHLSFPATVPNFRPSLSRSPNQLHLSAKGCEIADPVRKIIVFREAKWEIPRWTVTFYW